MNDRVDRNSEDEPLKRPEDCSCPPVARLVYPCPACIREHSRRFPVTSPFRWAQARLESAETDDYEKAQAAAAAFIAEQIGDEWANKTPEEIVEALKETEWYKTRQKLANPDG